MNVRCWIALRGACLVSAKSPIAGVRGALALTVLAAAVTGCAQGSNITTSSVQRSVPNDTAYVLPPTGGPAIIHILERGYSNAVQQEISLATDSSVSGQNYLRVKIFGNLDKRDAGEGSTSERSLAMANLGSEMRSAVRGVRMSKSPYFVQNRYGPFGYAIGRSGSDLCIYGWQNLRSSPSLIGNKGSIDIRLRLCQTDATERSLLAVMYGYTVNAYLKDSNWNPYGHLQGVPDSLGAAGPDVYPLGDDQFATVLSEPAPVAQPRRVRRAPRQDSAPPPPVVDEQPIGPAVPPPPTMELPAVPAVPSPAAVAQ